MIPFIDLDGSCALLINEHNNSMLFVRLLKMKNIIYERIPFIRLQSYKVTVLVCHPLVQTSIVTALAFPLSSLHEG
jgi:hypothetical protein